VIKLLGGRGAAAVMGAFMLVLASSGASAQDLSSLDISGAVRALDVDGAAKPLGTSMTTAAALARPAVATTTALAASNGTVFQAQPANSVTLKLATSVAAEAAWLYRAGWPLYALVDRYSAGTPLDEEANCLAAAVYFEARGETLDGQLAVARVVMNRAVSGRYPSSWCGVVKQPAQFSFVRHGQFPWIDTTSSAWARAQGVARLAVANVVPTVSTDVLWYHADYVAPSWGRRLEPVSKIGAHIFYRA
jgi:N-acetylmuramoyl-L-alanine amidase